MARSEELPHPVKVYIVQRLACFDRPSDVVKAVKEDFGLTVTRQRVHYYDPTSKLGAGLDPALKELFERKREEFRKELEAIPIANKAVQLRALDRALALAEQRGQIPMVIQTIEAAAEIAGTIVRKHEHTGKNGAPLPGAAPAQVTIIQLPDNGRG